MPSDRPPFGYEEQFLIDLLLDIHRNSHGWDQRRMSYTVGWSVNPEEQKQLDKEYQNGKIVMHLYWAVERGFLDRSGPFGEGDDQVYQHRITHKGMRYISLSPIRRTLERSLESETWTRVINLVIPTAAVVALCLSLINFLR